MPRALARLTFLACLACIFLSAFPRPTLSGDWTTSGDVIGEPLTLRAGEKTVLALYQKNRRKEGRGAVVLLPPPGGNADGAGLIRRLRLGLSEAGWDTLSLQLPVSFPSESPQRWLDRNAGFDTTIGAGLKWLTERGQLNQAIVAIGSSSRAAIAFGANSSAAELRAIVMISASLETGSASMDRLAALRIPVLDLYAERDHRAVLDTAFHKRRASNGNAAYRQRIVPGADSRFSGAADVVVSYVRAWLAANADGKQWNLEP